MTTTLVTTAVEVLNNMDVGAEYGIRDMARICDCPFPAMAALLRDLVDAGKVIRGKGKGNGSIRYHVPKPPLNTSVATTPAGPNANFKPLKGYDAALYRFRANCEASR